MPESLEDIREFCLKFEIPIERRKKFWEKLEGGKIFTSKCKSCGEIMFPPQADCSNCLSSDIEWIELDGKVTIRAFTHIVVRPETFRDEEPYSVAVGEFKEEEGLRVVAWLSGFRMDEIKVGMDAQLVAKPRGEGPHSYEFVPMEEWDGNFGK